MTPIHAAIAGAAMVYLFLVGVAWMFAGILVMSSRPEDYDRRRDWIALRLAWYVPLSALVAYLAFGMGMAFVGSPLW